MTARGVRKGAERRQGEIAHRLGTVVNALLALLKIAGGLLSGSPALLADGYHSLGDLATNAASWLSFRVADAPADDDHHFGHGKAESIAGLFVGALLVVVGFGVLWQATALAAPVYAGLEAPVAIVVAVASILANEWLVRVTARAAEALRSHALQALARDNRSDSLSSVLVIVGVGGTLAGTAWLEPLVTGIIGIFIVVMGARSLRENADVLMDRVTDPELRERITTLARTVEGVRGIQRIAVHPLGANLNVEIEISVDGDLSVRKGHAIAHEVEEAVTRAEPSVVQASVHVNPAS